VPPTPEVGRTAGDGRRAEMGLQERGFKKNSAVFALPLFMLSPDGGVGIFVKLSVFNLSIDQPPGA
jgi:hypothetical protein